jgi:hypothetical protein
MKCTCEKKLTLSPDMLEIKEATRTLCFASASLKGTPWRRSGTQKEKHKDTPWTALVCERTTDFGKVGPFLEQL